MSSDDDVAEKLNELVLATLDEALHLIRNGSPELKMQMIKGTMPTLTKSLDADAESESIVALRARQAALMDQVRSQLMPARPILDAIMVDVPEDTPAAVPEPNG